MPNEQDMRGAARVMARLAQLSRISETKGAITRRYLTPAHRAANELVGTWMREAGMESFVDAAGNIRGRYAGSDAAKAAIMFGSHLDSVIDAGAYDGCLGVVAAIEAVAALHRRGIRLACPVEIVGFADEEGARFGVTYLGSAAIAGRWNAAWFDAKDAEGITLREAMLRFGLNPDAVSEAQIPQEALQAYYELHIEQGIQLERSDCALAAVSGINGSKRFTLTITGETGHAGTIPMSWRHDPMLGAAAVMGEIERIAATYGDSLYCTLGYITCQPNLANCIPGEIQVRLDMRSSDADELDAAVAAVHKAAARICAERGLGFASEQFFASPLTRCSAALVQQVRQAVVAVQGKELTISSGAGHDAAEMAQVWPMAMIFMRCEKGLSHCPQENVRTDDVQMAVRVIQKILQTAGEQSDVCRSKLC